MRKILMSLMAVVPVLGFAHGNDSYRCTQGDAVRRVEIVHAAGQPVPCTVNYHKDTEAAGQVQELWTAANEEGFCSARAAEFVEKLEGWGWQCEVVAAREGAN